MHNLKHNEIDKNLQKLHVTVVWNTLSSNQTLKIAVINEDGFET